MNIKSTLVTDFGDFQLDTSRIELHSTSKTEIVLPYCGLLPADLSDATSAAIIITLRVGLIVNILLTVERAGKKSRYPIEATPQEINDILSPFFFDEDGHTRRDTGLDRYSMGLWQGSYINWRRLVLEEHGLDNLLFQIGPAAVERVLEHIRHSETA